MTVTLTPHAALQRRDIYSGITRVLSDGLLLALHGHAHPPLLFALSTVATIALDDDGGAIE